METSGACLDREIIRDFSSILYDMHRRQDLLGRCLDEAVQEMKELKEKNDMLMAKVSRLQTITVLNNIVIALKRDGNGEFEPFAIKTIVKELLDQANNLKRSEPSDDESPI